MSEYITDRKMTLLALQWCGMQQMSYNYAVQAGGLLPAENELMRTAKKYIGKDGKDWWDCKEFRSCMNELCQIDGHNETKVVAGILCGRCGEWIKRY